MIRLIMAIGSGNLAYCNGHEIPWPRIKADMKQFRKKTTGQALLMGRNTYEDEGPLEGRINVVLSNNLIPRKPKKDPTTRTCHIWKITEAFEINEVREQGLWVIGGNCVWLPMARLADELHITWVHGDWPFTNALDPGILEDFKYTVSAEHHTDPITNVKCTFAVLRRT